MVLNGFRSEKYKDIVDRGARARVDDAERTQRARSAGKLTILRGHVQARAAGVPVERRCSNEEEMFSQNKQRATRMEEEEEEKKDSLE